MSDLRGSGILKNIFLFLLVSGLAGVCILLGSVLGHSLGNVGLFSGAVVGGTAGVAAAVWMAARFGLVDRANLRATLLGGLLGFVIAAVIAVNNLQSPLFPVASVGIIGLGTVLGNAIGRKRSA